MTQLPQLMVVACMDARVDPLGPLGLATGEAYVLRNAGAHWSDDIDRSLRLARGLGVTRVRVVAHTDCAANGRDDAAATAAAHDTASRIRDAIPELEVDVSLLDLGTGISRRAE